MGNSEQGENRRKMRRVEMINSQHWYFYAINRNATVKPTNLCYNIQLFILITQSFLTACILTLISSMVFWFSGRSRNYQPCCSFSILQNKLLLGNSVYTFSSLILGLMFTGSLRITWTGLTLWAEGSKEAWTNTHMSKWLTTESDQALRPEKLIVERCRDKSSVGFPLGNNLPRN